MVSTEKLCLQWNDFKENITSSFKELRGERDFTDVTLACEDGQSLELHKVVLASTSPFFLELLKKNKHPHPLIYMKGLKSMDLVVYANKCNHQCNHINATQVIFMILNDLSVIHASPK